MVFTHDVFLSYSSLDKPVVHDLAVRLRDRGLRVWLDDWEIQPGDSVPARIEEGLETSAVLVLCMSEHALGSDWSALERHTFQFRDPLNRDRHFIPVRLDDATPRGSLAQFLAIDWRRRSDDELDKLTRSCRPGPAPAAVEEPRAAPKGPLSRTFSLGHTDGVNGVAYHPDGTRAISASLDRTVRIWNLATATCEHVLEGHTDSVKSVAYHPNGTHAISASDDRTVRVWNLTTATCEHVLEGHTGGVESVAYHPDGTHAISASDDDTVRVWNLTTATCEHVLEGHTDSVTGVAYHADGTHAISASADDTVRVWNLETATCEHVLEGHTNGVWGVAYHPDGTRAISASADRTVRVWNLATATCEHVLEGHTDGVRGVAYHPDGTRTISASDDCTMRVWNLATATCEHVLEGHTDGVRGVAYHPDGTRTISASDDCTMRVWSLATATWQYVLEGHIGDLYSVAFHPERTGAISASVDHTLRVWNLETGTCEHVLEGHTRDLYSVAYHPDGTQAISASADFTVRVWNLATGTCERVLRGHTDSVLGVAYHLDGTQAISASADRTVRVWNLATAICQQVLEGHTDRVWGVAYHPDGTRAITASDDHSLRVWNLATATCEHVLEGHTDDVWGVAYHPDGTWAISASADHTVRVWNLATATCDHVLEGHTDGVWDVAYHPQGSRAVSASSDGTVRVWNLETGTCEHVLEGHSDVVYSVAYHPDGATILSAAKNGVLRIWVPVSGEHSVPAPGEAPASYTNAKVVLVGESQAGKSGLAMRLAHDRWELTESTVGAWATQFEVPQPGAGGEREIWLWDFGGQADQRLVHQLYMGDAALAVLVFDGHREDTVARLWDWHRALRSSGRDVPTLLVAGRTDANPVRLSAAQLDELRDAGGFARYLETSAKHDLGCRELRDAIVESIDWNRIPWRSSPEVFRRLKRAILELKDSGRALTSAKELRDWLPAQIGPFEPAELDAVIGLLAGPGAVLPLEFGDYVLLRPELVNAYAQAVITSLRDDPLERGCIAEERVLNGELSFAPDFERLDEADERIVLHAMHRQLVERAICLREHDARGKQPTVLVFPSFYRRERPDRPGQPQSFMTYRFSGFLDEVYATLVVRLHHTEPFDSAQLWRNAADLQTAGGKAIGLRLTRGPDGTGELELHCDPTTPAGDQALFAGYVLDHLKTRARDVTRLRTYICPKCDTPVENRDAARRRLEAGKPDIVCSFCEHRVTLYDEIERRLSDPATQAAVGKLRDAAQVVLDNESRERLLVGEAYAMAARANQIARELPISDHGIDMEIEFKTDEGRATGRKLYLQLKSGDSHLRARKRDDARVFQIKDDRHADYWADQDGPVMLVIRDSEGAIEWMEIGERLRAQRASGDWPARQIAFDGERFDVMSIRRWRDRMLEAP